MNYAEFNERFPESTEIGRDVTENEITVYCDNGREVGVCRIDRRSTIGKGEILTPENSWIARLYYDSKSSHTRNRQ